MGRHVRRRTWQTLREAAPLQIHQAEGDALGAAHGPVGVARGGVPGRGILGNATPAQLGIGEGTRGPRNGGSLA